MFVTLPTPFTTFWISAAIVLWFLLLIGGFGFYTPTLPNQIKALESQGANGPVYQELNRRGTIGGIILAVITIAIIFLMVFKPNFA